MLGKKGELSTGWIVAIAIAAILLFDIGGAGTWAKSQLGMSGTTASGGSSTPTIQQVVTEAPCYIEDTTVTVGPASQRYKPTTKATVEYHQVYKNGVDKGKVKDGSTLTANPKDKLEIYYAANSTQTNSAGYYAAKQVFTVPCVGEVTTAEAPDSDAYQIFKDDLNNLTKQIFNWNNGNLNSASDPMTLGAGDKKTNTLKLFGTYQNGFSPYGKIAACVFGNLSTYQKIVLGDYPTVAKPSHLTNPPVLITDATSWCYELPGIRSNEEISTTMYVEVKSTPGDDTVTNIDSNNIAIYFLDQDWYQHTIDGNMQFGYENNDGDDVGIQDFNMTIDVQ